jgi:hypothetical protein
MQLAMTGYLPLSVRTRISSRLLLALDRRSPVIFLFATLLILTLSVVEIAPHAGDLVRSSAEHAILAGQFPCDASGIGHPLTITSGLPRSFPGLCRSSRLHLGYDRIASD